jgi:uroporphyrinogen-III synthase
VGRVLGPLEGFTVAVTADRRAGEQAELLERRGARVVHGPCIRTLAVSEEAAMEVATRALLARPPDYLIANTGIGMRGWFTGAASWGVEDDLLRALSTARVLARGPKAVGATAAAGLSVWWRDPEEQLAGVVRRLLAEPLAGKRVAVQLAGDSNDEVTDPLRAAGAEVVVVPVYRWTLPVDAGPARRVVAATAEALVDVVTFTSPSAVHNFFAMAADDGLAARVREAFHGTVTALAVGPVTAAALRREGVEQVVAPERGRLGAMVRMADMAVARRRVHLQDGVVVQGSAVAGPGHRAALTDKERRVFEELVSRGGAPVARDRLRARAWRETSADDRALEVTVHRLRRKLGPAGDALVAVAKRGYRLDLTSQASCV